MEDYEEFSLKKIFNREFISLLEAININISGKINNQNSGIRKSNKNGNSMEFSDYKKYTIGDDLRRVDWKTYSRFGKIFIKMFQEEKQAKINICLDISKSMNYGKKDKGNYGKILAGAISYIGLKNSELVSVYTFDNKIIDKKDIKTKSTFPLLLKFLDDTSYGDTTDLFNSIKDLTKQTLNSGITIIISDFFDKSLIEDNILVDVIKMLQSKNQQIALIQVVSKEEEFPECDEGVSLVDSETGSKKEVFITKKMVDDYKKEFLAYNNSILNICTKRNVKYIYTVTDKNVSHIVKELC